MISWTTLVVSFLGFVGVAFEVLEPTRTLAAAGRLYMSARASDEILEDREANP